MDASTANIVTDCDGLLNPADWTNNIANAIKNGGQSFGVGLTSALTSADPLYSEMETSLTQWGYDWTNDFEPYVFGAGVYMSPLNGFLEVDLNNDATIDTTYYTRNWNVDRLLAGYRNDGAKSRRPDNKSGRPRGLDFHHLIRNSESAQPLLLVRLTPAIG